jgi:hypothetical protein
MKQAIFLVGGPGSGKDIILKNLPQFEQYSEYNIEQLKSIISENRIVITANSYNCDKIKLAKDLLESLYYKTSMIYVDVSDSASYHRMASRNINEDVRKDRLAESKTNLEIFREMFSEVYYFNNSYNLKSSLTRVQIESLQEKLKISEELPEVKFKKHLIKIVGKKRMKNDNIKEVPWNPTSPSKDGFNQTFDTRDAGNGALMQNYEAMDPGPVMDSGIGFGSTYGNISKQEFIDTSHSATEPFNKNKKRTNFEKDKEVEKEIRTPTFSKVKRIVFKREK